MKRIFDANKRVLQIGWGLFFMSLLGLGGHGARAEETPPPSQTEQATAFQVDPYEQDLHETYTNYYSRKISAEEWSNIRRGFTGDTYTIKEKDTLWRISKLLFNDPNYWPKLWSVNATSITNPHLIRPGTQLGFTHGTVNSSPSLNIVEGDSKAPQEVATKRPIPDLIKNSKIKIPPPSADIKPVIKVQDIPSSLGPLDVGFQADDNNLKIEFGKLNIYSTSFLPYFMSSHFISSIAQGKVLRKKDNDGLWSHTGQRIILEMRDSVNPGQRLTIAKDLGKISSSKLGVRGPFGYQVEVQGEVEIKGRVPDSFDLYEAEVTKSINPIANGSVVINRPMWEFDFTPTDISGSAESQIIGLSPFSDSMTLAPPHSLVYLNRGSANNLAVGQMYQIKANLTTRDHSNYGYDITIGKLKIVYVEERFATAILTDMAYDIQIGDYAVPLSSEVLTDKNYDPFKDDSEEELQEAKSYPSDDDGDDLDFDDEEDMSESPSQINREISDEKTEEVDEEELFDSFE